MEGLFVSSALRPAIIILFPCETFSKTFGVLRDTASCTSKAPFAIVASSIRAMVPAIVVRHANGMLLIWFGPN